MRDVSHERSAALRAITPLLCRTDGFGADSGRVADRAVQIFGGAGYMGDYGIERFYRDARLFRIYEGTTQIQQIQQILIARNMVKADA